MFQRDEGEQCFTEGTDGLHGAKGSVRFSLIGKGPAAYQASSSSRAVSEPTSEPCRRRFGSVHR
jgi:hypothetical protein